MAAAVFGDGRVSLLQDYVRRNPELQHGYMFYGVPGMTTNNVSEEMFQSLIRSKPKKVFIILGGDDIKSGCQVRDIVKNLQALADALKRDGCKEVFVSNIMERGKFIDDMTHKRFNQVRRSVNKKLRKMFKDNLIDVPKKVKFPKHYSRDLVNPGEKEGGLRILSFVIHRVLK